MDILAHARHHPVWCTGQPWCSATSDGIHRSHPTRVGTGDPADGPPFLVLVIGHAGGPAMVELTMLDADDHLDRGRVALTAERASAVGRVLQSLATVAGGPA